MSDIPTLTARRETRNGARLLIAVCPVCGVELVLGDAVSDFTHRVSHCSCWPHGYYLETATQQKEAPVETNQEY